MLINIINYFQTWGVGKIMYPPLLFIMGGGKSPFVRSSDAPASEPYLIGMSFQNLSNRLTNASTLGEFITDVGIP